MPSRPGLVFAVSALLLTSALGTAACSSDVPPTTPPPVTTNDGGAVDPGAAAGDGGTGDPTTCAKTTSFVECEVCCGLDDTFAESQQVYADCICAGPCKDACGTTACGTDDVDPDEACQTCLDADATKATCAPKAKEFCDSKPSCKAFIACDTAAACDDKE